MMLSTGITTILISIAERTKILKNRLLLALLRELFRNCAILCLRKGTQYTLIAFILHQTSYTIWAKWASQAVVRLWVMTNSKHFPKQLIKAKKAAKNKEYSNHFNALVPVVAIRWTNKSPIYFLSNAHLPSHPDAQVTRHMKDGSSIIIPCTPSVQEYKKYMGRVAVNDKMSGLDESRKSYKWHTKIGKVYYVGDLQCLHFI